jgi:hypothetical protein
MKTKTKDKTTVMQQLRDIREKISDEIKGMTIEQLNEYFKNQKTLHPAAHWRKINDTQS